MSILKKKSATRPELDVARFQAMGAETRRGERQEHQPVCALAPTHLAGREADAWLNGYTEEARSRG